MSVKDIFLYAEIKLNSLFNYKCPFNWHSSDCRLGNLIAICEGPKFKIVETEQKQMNAYLKYFEFYFCRFSRICLFEMVMKCL